MPWQEVSVMSSRLEFCRLAQQAGSNIRELCRRFSISPKTGYKWLQRFKEQGEVGLKDVTRRPKRSPTRTSAKVEKAVLELRRKYPYYGARKLQVFLRNKKGIALPTSTLTNVLRRHGCLDLKISSEHVSPQRFEREAPNELWQMDFKGHFDTGAGRCHPLVLLDDHARFAVCLKACANEQRTTVQEALVETFRRYGLPEAILADHGPPWGYDPEHVFTCLSLWLMRLGIGVLHGRPRHPQTQGKLERFNRTLKVELLQSNYFRQLAACQKAFDSWRLFYNVERPHEALGMEAPVTRYRPSPRTFPEVLPPIEYDEGDVICSVDAAGHVKYGKHPFVVTRALSGQKVAVRPLSTDGVFGVFYGSVQVYRFELNAEV